MTRLTPRFSRNRANSVCGSWQSWTRSCIARMTSALPKSWSAMNCRDPTATGGFGQAPHVANFPPRRCCVQVVHIVNYFCFQWVPLRSNFGVGDVKFLQEGRHQDRVTHDVAVIHVPQVCQASIFLQCMLRVVGIGKLFWAAKLEVG